MVTTVTKKTKISSLSQIGPEEIRRGGCPQGSTKLSQHEKKQREKRCLDGISQLFATTKTEFNLLGKRLPNGCLHDIIQAKKHKYNVPDLVVNYTTIQSRNKRQNTAPKH